MSCGLSCIASRIRGNIDLLESTCRDFLCKPHDAREFSHKIDILANDAELRFDLGLKNSEVISHFGVVPVCNDLKKIYKQITG